MIFNGHMDLNNKDNSNRIEKSNEGLELGYNFISKQFNGIIHERMIRVLLDLGICDILCEDSKPRTADELCNLCKLISLDGMVIALNYFVFHQFINYNQSNDTYSSNENTKYFTKSNKLYGLVNLYSSDCYYDLFKFIPTSFYNYNNNKKDSNINSGFNNNQIWEILGLESNKLLFKEGMASLTEITINEIINTINFEDSKTIVDVGGSHGLLVKKIIEKYPHIKGINFDLENIISTNKISDNPRLNQVAGSFFENVPIADTYLLKLILHDWNDDRCVEILNTISKSMVQGGKIYIFDYIYEDQKDSNLLGYTIKMYTIFNGKERSRSEWIQLLEKANFKIDKIFNNKSFLISKINK